MTTNSHPRQELVLDACCGSKMFWFDKNNPLTVYQDIRTVDTQLCDGRQLVVSPDVLGDFTNMSWPDCKFKIVVLDPPHLDTAGDKGWQALKYGKLPGNWKKYLTQMFNECFRVLEDDGVLIFKWNETQISYRNALACSEYLPMCGQKRRSKTSKTHWAWFLKNDAMKESAK